MKSVAILGASKDRAKFGNKSLRAHVAAGYEVFPIHPKETEIEGLAAYGALADLPHAVERISVYLAPPVGRALLPGCPGGRRETGSARRGPPPGDTRHRRLQHRRSRPVAVRLSVSASSRV